jgi:diguanylate cyclase (GGDEF)-like protein
MAYFTLNPTDVFALRHFAFQLTVIFGLLLLFFFGRRWKFGLIPLYVTLATFPHLQTNLAISKFEPIYKNYQISPGSAVLFTSTLFIVQLIYIFKDAIELRKLCTVLVFSSVLSTVFMYFFGAHESFRPDETALGTIAVSALKVMLWGNFALILDLLAIPTGYELLGRLRVLPVWSRILITMSVVSVVDSLIFLAGGFYGTLGDSEKGADFWFLFQGAVIGKLVACALLTTYLSIYLVCVERRNDLGRPANVKFYDLYMLFKYLLYCHNDYQQIRDKYSRDEATGVFSSRQLDSYLGAEIEQSERAATPLCLLKVDIKKFSDLEKKHGKPRAQQVISIFADTITDARQRGLVFRTGDDEFSVILNSGGERGEQIAVSIIHQIKDLTQQWGAQHIEPITAFGSVASTDEPVRKTTDLSLRRATARRLYEVKRGGGGLVRAKDNGKPSELPSNGHIRKDVLANGETPNYRPGQHDSSSGASAPLSSVPDEVARLNGLLGQREATIRELKARINGPAGSTLIFEQTYEGTVRSDEGDEVVVRFYDAVEDDIIEQVYGKSQFKEGNPPTVGQQITTWLRIYQSDLSDESDGISYEFRPREIISGRVEL